MIKNIKAVTTVLLALAIGAAILKVMTFVVALGLGLLVIGLAYLLVSIKEDLAKAVELAKEPKKETKPNARSNKKPSTK